MAFWSDLCLSIRGNVRECMTTPLSKKKALIIGGVVIVIIIIIIIIAVSVHKSGPGPATKGSDVIRNYAFVLGGNGASETIKKKNKNKIDSNINALLGIDDLINGYVSTQVWDLGASKCADAEYHDAVSQTLDQIDLLYRIFKTNSNLTLITNSAEIQKAKDNKKIGSILRVDGGYALDGKLSIIRMYYNLGVRILNLGGKCDNSWCKSAWSGGKCADPLDPFGKTIVQEMSRLGMIIDISGACGKAQMDIMEEAKTQKVPVLLSHSGSNMVSNPNNVDAEVLKKVKEVGGLLQLSLDQAQVCGKDTTGKTDCNITQVIAHLNNLRTILDPPNIGIGGDFGDASVTYPTDLNNPSKFKDLFDRLLSSKVNDKTAWTEEDLKKLAGDNFIRIFQAVEKVAQEKASKEQPSNDFIDKKLIANVTCYTDFDERY